MTPAQHFAKIGMLAVQGSYPGDATMIFMFGFLYIFVGAVVGIATAVNLRDHAPHEVDAIALVSGVLWPLAGIFWSFLGARAFVRTFRRAIGITYRILRPVELPRATLRRK